jgi:hypothetical protein
MLNHEYDMQWHIQVIPGSRRGPGHDDRDSDRTVRMPGLRVRVATKH